MPRRAGHVFAPDPSKRFNESQREVSWEKMRPSDSQEREPPVGRADLSCARPVILRDLRDTRKIAKRRFRQLFFRC
jgi:hypothetical protein